MKKYEIYARHITWENWHKEKRTNDKRVAIKTIRYFLAIGCDIMVYRSDMGNCPFYFERGNENLYLDSYL